MKGILTTVSSLLCLSAAFANDLAPSGDRDRVDILPGQFHEPCMALQRGETLFYEFSADQALEFNLHYHPGKNVEYPIPVMLTEEGKGSFKAGSNHTYCLMWQNLNKETAMLSFSWKLKKSG